MSASDKAGSEDSKSDSLLEQILRELGPTEDDPPIELDPASPPRLECPICHSPKILPIVYGFPGPKTVDMAVQGLLELGGDGICGKEKTWRCSSCRHQWGMLATREIRSRQEYRTMLAWIDKHHEPLSDDARQAKNQEMEQRIEQMRLQLEEHEKRRTNDDGSVP